MADREWTGKSVGVAVAAMVGSALGASSVIFYTLPLLMVPITKEFGWGRGAFSLVMVIASGLAAISTPFVGKAIDRWGVRPVTLFGIALFSLANASLASMNGSLIRLYLLYVPVGIGASIAGPVAFAKAISAWFHRKRGLVLGLGIGIGLGIGGAATPWIVRALIPAVGWRGVYLTLAAAILLINLPLCALLLAEPVRAVRPGHDSKLHLSAEQAYGIPISEARRSPTLWFLLAAQLLASISLSGIVGHSVPLLTDRGVSSTLAAGVLSSVGLATVLGRIVSGYLQDVFGSPRVALLFFVAPLFGLFMIGVGSGPGVLIAAGVVLGLGMGAEGEIMPYFVSRYFGLRAFGEIYSYIYAAFVIGAGFGPFLIGFSFDATGSYRLALRGVEVAMAVAVLFLALLGPYVYSAGRENAPRDHFIEAVPQDSV